MDNICFIIMPFGSLADDPSRRGFWTEVYEEILVPSIARAAPGFKCLRADEIASSNNIIADVVAYLCDARLVIADLTGSNANVFYELGVRHALGKPTVLIAQDLEDIPFDLRP